MNRNILLIEPNYKNKFPPIGLMKISTYHKRMGDNVVFYKGDLKDFIIQQIADKCVDKLNEIQPAKKWNGRKDSVIKYIKTRKKEYLVSILGEDFDEYTLLVTSWLEYYRDYYHKKIYLKNPDWDRIFVTTLFTFYFDITVKTINDAKPLLKEGGLFMVGGVLATIQPDEIEAATGIKPFKGLLNTPGELDEGNTDIIDALPLDYTILEEVDYSYEMSNAYYAYLSRGCIRSCKFCAVPKLEPDYQDFIPLKQRIDEVRDVCGEQRDLLLMDNNILASKQFDDVIEEIIACGFERGATVMAPNLLEVSVKNLIEGRNDRGYIRKAQKLMTEFLNSIKDKDLSYKIYSILYKYDLLKYETATKEDILTAYKEIEPYYTKSREKLRPRQRVVDFNQGLDARLFNDHVASQLARTAISPVRIAFDNLAVEPDYVQAIKMCANHGLKNFSNYLLYNFNDKPEELYHRLRINVELCDELHVNIYSFPMKFHPLYGDHSHDRNYIGKHWNRKYIRAVQAILNCTKGMIGKGTTYFYKAFGEDIEHFHLLLDMPDTYIIYRYFFEWLQEKNHPYSTYNWEQTYKSLSANTREVFLSIIHDENFSSVLAGQTFSGELAEIMKFYVNLRDSVQNTDGKLYALKQEYDALSSVHSRRAKALQEKKENAFK